jgi:CRISPR-associated protein Cas4
MFGNDIQVPFLVNRGKEFETEIDLNHIKVALERSEDEHIELLKNEYFVDRQLMLKGTPDIIAAVSYGFIPIEIKYTEMVPANSFYQLIAYAMLIERKFKKPVKKAYIFYGKTSELLFKSFIIEDIDKAKMLKTISSIHSSILDNQRPKPTENTNKCHYCEYRNFCGDVI